MARVFVAVDLPREAINEILRIQNIIKKKTLFTGKLTEGENLHLTLKFFGEITEEQINEIKIRLKDIKFNEFIARTGELGVFNPDFIKIIWIKLNGRGIFELQKEIDKKLSDLFLPENRFMSHITIARVKNVGDKKAFVGYLTSIKPKEIEFSVDKFFLKKSELAPLGPKYEDIETFNSTKEKI
jgi:RNA 2',3'-cyclic 3'-phosphodiesterase